MMPRYPQRFWLAALLVAWSVDFLFWNKAAGVSFVVLVAVMLAAGFSLSRMEAVRPARTSYLLGGLVLILAGVTIWRSEGFTRVLNAMLALFGLGLLALTLPTGAWLRYRMIDYFAGGFELIFAAMSRAAGMPIIPKGEKGTAGRAVWGQAAPVLRGLLLAAPVVLVMGTLLASADLIFADQLRQFFKVFDLDRLPEYLFRLFYILLLTYGFAGIYLFAVLQRRLFTGFSAPSDPASILSKPAGVPLAETIPPAEVTPADSVESDAAALAVPQTPAQPAVSNSGWRFLGVVEAFIVLGSVDLLFAFFVGVQFRYFFGGQSNIKLDGYTYSEYARSGFFELVWVAVLSLMLYLTLNAITRRAKPTQEKIFTGLSVLLVGLVWVILVSAFQRLLLYEDAYGFTSLRTYTHIFIPWLGFLLLATMILQITRREIYFGGVLLLTVFGFALTFGIMNVDSFIAQQNIQRAWRGNKLDGLYLTTLSDDALPVMVREFQRAEEPSPTHETLGYVLACRAYAIKQEPPKPWQSYHPGQAMARQSLVGVDLSAYQVFQENGRLAVQLDNDLAYCETDRSWD